jgi:hypothetical protein
MAMQLHTKALIWLSMAVAIVSFFLGCIYAFQNSWNEIRMYCRILFKALLKYYFN